jgi:ubiquinone/menaquinone biosynthesis C-methylase UbiE
MDNSFDSTNSVKDVYNSISDSFSKTRVKVWPCVSRFLDSMKGKGLEVGCGNGKNMFYRKDLQIQGIDICPNFVKLCNESGLKVIEGTMTNIPYEDSTFDFVYCIAALHHLNSLELRVKAIQEMIRVCKPNGTIFILVWAFEQEADSKRKFETQDVFVPWNDKGIIQERFYHVYKKDELYKEVSLSTLNIVIKDSFYEKGNWGIIIQKL